MDHKELVPLLESNLDRQLQWIAAADKKAAFTFTLATAMLGILASVAPKSACAWTIAPAIFTCFSVALSVSALFCLSFATFPRTKGPRGSLVFCAGIAQRSADQFKEATDCLSLEAYTADLALQCHRNAEIATLKFTWIQRALVCLYFSVIPWAIALWLLYSGTPRP
jgi:hypothetical protein